MAPRHFYRNDAGTMVEITKVPTDGWSVQENAEEGQAASITLSIPDPNMEYEFIGHRRWIVYEDDSSDANEVIFSGFVAAQSVGRTGGSFVEPLGRVWTLTLVDMNSLWERRVLVGSDTKRPSETDVARMEWLVATNEMGYFDDTTLISSGSTVTLDKRNVRGQTTKQVADECAQQAGKNYWIGSTGSVAGGYQEFVWYGKDTLGSYACDLSLSNDPTDWTDATLLDGTSLVWPVSFDSVVDRSPDRVYDGVYVEYEKGAVYRKKAATTDYFTLSGRDLAHPAPEIKSKTRAIARANRLLNQSDTQLEVFKGSVQVPAALASKIRAGMLIDIKMTHVPGWETGQSCRILSAMPQPVAAASQYRITIEAEALAPVASASCSTALAAATADEATGLESVTTTASVSTVHAASGYVVALLLGCNGNTPNAENMGNPTGYTVLDNQADFSRSTWSLAYKAVSGSGTATASAAFTAGFSASGVWLAAQTWLPWSAVTVVQEAIGGVDVSTATFASDPTPGNTILMLVVTGGLGAITLGGGGVGPSTGWTELFNLQKSNSNALVQAGLYARCVQSGDGKVYDYSVSNANLMSDACYIVEIAT